MVVKFTRKIVMAFKKKNNFSFSAKFTAIDNVVGQREDGNLTEKKTFFNLITASS